VSYTRSRIAGTGYANSTIGPNGSHRTRTEISLLLALDEKTGSVFGGN
jgi:hypothetical protein